MKQAFVLLLAAVLVLSGCTRMVSGVALAPGEASDWARSQGAGVTVGGAGDAAQHITVFLDFQCPFCKQFEDTYGEAITRYVGEGKLAVSYRPVSFLDRVSASGDYSSRAAAALFLVAGSGAGDAVILRFIGEMYRQQPEEGVGNLTNLQISAIAAAAGVTGDMPHEIAAHQLTDEDRARTAGNEQQMDDRGLEGVPGVIDGSGAVIDPSDPDWLTRLVGTR